MSCSIRIALAIGALSTAALVFPAHAQLQGNGSGNVAWSTAGADAAARAQPGNARPSPASLGAPRGDLRRDVSEASRALPPHRGE